MSNEAMIQFATREIEHYRARLGKLEASGATPGVSDGVVWTETSQDEIEYALTRIAELSKFLENAGVDRD